MRNVKCSDCDEYRNEWCKKVKDSPHPDLVRDCQYWHERKGLDNLISKQAAIDALKKAYWDKDLQAAKDDPCVIDAMTDWAIRQIKALPSAQPERPNGEWIMTKELDEDVAACPFCGAEMRRKSTGEKPEPPNFCHSCGADLRGGREHGLV